MGAFALLYGIVCYAIFFLTFLYAIGFVGNLVVPKSIDAGLPAGDSGLAEALIVNVLLLGVFAVQHSVMARPAFKRWWTRLVPKAVERSTYVLFASLAPPLLAMAADLGAGVERGGNGRCNAARCDRVRGLGAGAAQHVPDRSLRAVRTEAGRRAPLGASAPAPVFRTPLFYRHVRHPIYLGFLLAFWATPVMSAGHLLFALATSGYILIGIWFEERDLIALFGDTYRRYRNEVAMLLPLPRRRAPDAKAPSREAPTRT